MAPSIKTKGGSIPKNRDSFLALVAMDVGPVVDEIVVGVLVRREGWIVGVSVVVAFGRVAVGSRVGLFVGKAVEILFGGAVEGSLDGVSDAVETQVGLVVLDSVGATVGNMVVGEVVGGGVGGIARHCVRFLPSKRRH